MGKPLVAHLCKRRRKLREKSFLPLSPVPEDAESGPVFASSASRKLLSTNLHRSAFMLRDQQPSLPISQRPVESRRQTSLARNFRFPLGRVWATDASVQHRRRQEFEIPDLKLAAFLKKNGLEIEIRIKILALLQVFHADPLSLRHILKFLR